MKKKNICLPKKKQKYKKTHECKYMRQKPLSKYWFTYSSSFKCVCNVKINIWITFLLLKTFYNNQ